MKKYLSIVIMLCIISIAGCYHPVYKFLITGVDVSAEKVVVNQPVTIHLKTNEINNQASVEVQYVWTIDGAKVKTDKSYVVVTFTTVGVKECTVYPVLLDDDYITNTYVFSINVQNSGE